VCLLAEHLKEVESGRKRRHFMCHDEELAYLLLSVWLKVSARYCRTPIRQLLPSPSPAFPSRLCRCCARPGGPRAPRKPETNIISVEMCSGLPLRSPHFGPIEKIWNVAEGEIQDVLKIGRILLAVLYLLSRT
jgi:hypothetical protein